MTEHDRSAAGLYWNLRAISSGNSLDEKYSSEYHFVMTGSLLLQLSFWESVMSEYRDRRIL